LFEKFIPAVLGFYGKLNMIDGFASNNNSGSFFFPCMGKVLVFIIQLPLYLLRAKKIEKEMSVISPKANHIVSH
jgi:hypothetical protein